MQNKRAHGRHQIRREKARFWLFKAQLLHRRPFWQCRKCGSLQLVSWLNFVKLSLFSRGAIPTKTEDAAIHLIFNCVIFVEEINARPICAQIGRPQLCSAMASANSEALNLYRMMSKSTFRGLPKLSLHLLLQEWSFYSQHVPTQGTKGYCACCLADSSVLSSGCR